MVLDLLPVELNFDYTMSGKKWSNSSPGSYGEFMNQKSAAPSNTFSQHYTFKIAVQHLQVYLSFHHVVANTARSYFQCQTATVFGTIKFISSAS